MDKLTAIKIKNPDGTYSDQMLISVLAENVIYDETHNLIDILNKLRNSMNAIVGTPVVARTIAEMSDTSKIYVYVGSESGYTNGNWYYYSNSEWVSGGVYNSVVVDTDTTLTVANKAADAQAVGDKFNLVNTQTNEKIISIRTLLNQTDDKADKNAADIVALTSALLSTDATAQNALASASNAENEAAETANEIDNIKRRLSEMTLKLDSKIDDAYLEDGYQYMTSDGTIVVGPLGPFAGGGGGSGGGSSTNNAIMNVTNTTGWLSKTISEGSSCEIHLSWSSTEDEMPTGDGALKITVNNSVRSSQNISQGDVTVDLAPYVAAGSNVVKVQVSDIYGNARTINFSITVISLRISSTFETTVPFSGAVPFAYTPTGQVQKTVHFIVDGTQVGTQTTSVSGRQMTYTIPAQNHGAHTLRCYFEAEVNNETVRSNELYYEFMSLTPLNTTTIITSSFNESSVNQYSLINIPYRVYAPNFDTAEVKIFINNMLVSTQTVGRTEQSYALRVDDVGLVTFKIQSNGVTKTISFNVTESEIDIEPVTDQLELHLTAQGRSNNSADRNEWKYNDISATMTNFGYHLDGWLNDDDGVDILRLAGDARVTIPFKVFETDFKNTGFTLEIEFATREVVDYSAEIMSCFADNIGFKITPQSFVFRGAQTEVSSLYKDNEHITLAFTVDKQNENRLILAYINGIASKSAQYASGERFSQLNPVGITIGSNSCGIDIYKIRVYRNNLNRQQIVDNWTADTQIGSLMLERYSRNRVYDAYGRITTETLPKDLPYMILEGAELSQYKDDKKTITGSYHDPVYPSKSFDFSGCQINVQGTSSAVYYRKNYDLQFKEGFMTPSGTIQKYALRAGSIPFNRFVLKADVASSESTNNTGLTMFYNDTCPYKTPEMLADSRVRWGIEGVPIAVFWYNPETQITEFMGKYNFNLPKRAPEPYGYSGNDQSWEFERNNSANVKFQDDDFTHQDWDEIKQAYYPTWYDDWEARFPSDEWRDYSALKEFVSWVKSTWRDAATNETLPEPVSYHLKTTTTVDNYSDDTSYTVQAESTDGIVTGYTITFTKDTPAYRLSKFKAELDDYVEIESATFYYLFTEMFLMIDSRAKNMFVGFHGSEIDDPNRQMTRKAVFEPYDMDTAVGTNNSGVLMFGYGLEDTDKVSSIISGGEGGTEANVFNAQDSVFWVNFRDSSRSEIAAMYRTLRSNSWSYKIVETMYENHQSKWPEAIFNEDAYVKYLTPLIEPVTIDEATGQPIKTDRYLTMLQGSKTEQRKWWLWNRFKYMDSKYSTGDASTNRISLRMFGAGTLTITPAIDMYVGVYFGGGTRVALQRTTANTPVSFPYIPGTTLQEMETWIDSADMITDVGDLSPLYPNEIEFSRATRLRRLKIGSAAAGYSNTNLTTLDVRNSALLESVDCRNCPNLAMTINLEGSPRLEEAYFEGTSITGIELTDGGAIRILHLPGTITTLTLLNLDKLSDLSIASYSNISRLMLANIDQSIVNPLIILRAIQPNSQVNIQGLHLEMADATQIEEFFDLLDTMSGVTREKGLNGEWLYHDYDTAQVSGTIHTPTLTGAQVSEFNARYPYITIDADHVTSYLRYYNYNSSTGAYDTLMDTVTCIDGVPERAYGGATPKRVATAANVFTFNGWSKSQNATTPDGDAETNVVADRDIYASFAVTGQTYTVTFVRGSADGGGTLQTINNVAYGTVITAASAYTGSTPTTSQGNATDYPFEGWEPASATVQGNTTFTAKFGSPIQDVEITDSWDTIIANIDNGTYKTKYQLGNYKPLDLGTEGTINMQIVGIDVDELADGSGTAPITFIAKEPLKTLHNMNNSKTTSGGWAATGMRTYLKDTIKPLIPSNVSSRINAVTKYSRLAGGTEQITTDDVWIPSRRELGSTSVPESSGSAYSKVYKDRASRIKKRVNDSSAYEWWTRSATNYQDFGSIVTNGNDVSSQAVYAYGVALGFCLGLEPDTITDSWDDIITATQDGTYSTKYSVGDTKTLDLGAEGKVKMQLVAMDTDDLADGSGKAKTTWISRELLKTPHNMNASGATDGGWASTEMRSYLKSTIKPLIPSGVSAAIKDVTKYSRLADGTEQTTTDDVWIPGRKEVAITSSPETSGATYSGIFSNNASRIKKKAGASSGSGWWLRSASNAKNFGRVYGDGDSGNYAASNNIGVALGFCI